jgi:hypothetical protein
VLKKEEILLYYVKSELMNRTLFMLIRSLYEKTMVSSASDFYDEECADRMFDKYMKDAEPEYDKYLHKADDVPLPVFESEVDDYLDSLDPLLQRNI